MSPPTPQGSPRSLGEPHHDAVRLSREPGQFLLVAAPLLRLALKERLGLGQDERVRPSDAPGLMAHRELGRVDPLMHVATPVLCKWPLVDLPIRGREEAPERIAEVAFTPGGQIERPVDA